MLPVYRDTGSRIHALHPAVIIASVLSIFTASLISTDAIYLTLLLLITLAFAAAGRILRQWSAMMKFTLYLSVSIFVISLFLVPAGTWWSVWGIPVPSGPVLTSIPLILRLDVSVSAFLVLSLCVDPDRILDYGSGSKTLMAVSIGSRLYPLIAGDEAEIEDVMRVRGVEMDAGGRLERIRNRGSLLLPLLIGSLERGMSMAESMESRSFSGRRRGRSVFHVSMSEWEWFLLSLQIAAICVFLADAMSPAALFGLPLSMYSIPLFLTLLAGGAGHD